MLKPCHLAENLAASTLQLEDVYEALVFGTLSKFDLLLLLLGFLLGSFTCIFFVLFSGLGLVLPSAWLSSLIWLCTIVRGSILLYLSRNFSCASGSIRVYLVEQARMSCAKPFLARRRVLLPVRAIFWR